MNCGLFFTTLLGIHPHDYLVNYWEGMDMALKLNQSDGHTLWEMAILEVKWGNDNLPSVQQSDQFLIDIKFFKKFSFNELIF